ncbi:MAG: LVIVD repeat-containing protein [Acidimicrobiia bacterium]
MRTRHRSLAAILLLAAVGTTAPPVGATGDLTDRPSPAVGTANIVPVANVAHRGGASGGPGGGTDIEFAEIGGTTYALAGTLERGLQILDISDPARPRPVAVYDCRVAQGDVQVVRRDGRTFVAYAADYDADRGSACYRDLDRKGIAYGNGLGTVVVDISDPARPTTVSFLPMSRGTHNSTINPAGTHLYNSNSDTSGGGVIEYWDLTGDRLLHPVKLGELPTAGANSHDITFNADGTRAYSAALDHSLVIDTSDPARPQVVGRIGRDGLDVHHQAEPLTVTGPDGLRRDLLLVTDEVNGGRPATCPGGGIHVYDVTGDKERAPVRLGAWFIDDATRDDGRRGCTSHVLRLHPEAGLMTIAWYRKGVRVVDLGGLALAGETDASPMAEVGWYAFPDANTWSVKTPGISPDGSFHLFANDLARGLDVFRFDPAVQVRADPGTWLTAEDLAATPREVPDLDDLVLCLLPTPG